MTLINKIFPASLHSVFLCFLITIFVLLSGCQTILPSYFSGSRLPVPKTKPPLQHLAQSPRMPLATHEFTFDATRDDVVGRLQIVQAKEEDTLSDIARRFNLGLEEILHANPNVDPWLPGEGTPIIIPTEFVLPNAPREGVVINLAAMRLFYFPKAKSGKSQKVITHPVGIGRVEWKTPEGLTRVTAKEANPSWIPPESIRKEHAANGDPLPAVVKPGPDNPMGTHVLRLGWPSYAIHGTNKPPSVGLRGSHGCLRMYPEDIARIFKEIPVGTPVRIVNQPRLLGWRDHTLYLQVYPTLEDDKRNHNTLLHASLTRIPMTQKAKLSGRKQTKINTVLLREATLNPRGVAIPVSNSNITLQKHIDSAIPTLNVLPFNANWDGDNNQYLTAAEVIQHINEKSEQNR